MDAPVEHGGDFPGNQGGHGVINQWPILPIPHEGPITDNQMDQWLREFADWNRDAIPRPAHLTEYNLHCLAAKLLSWLVDIIADQERLPDELVWQDLLSNQDLDFYSHSGLFGHDHAGRPLPFDDFLEERGIDVQSFADVYIQDSLGLIAVENGYERVHPPMFR